jgi:hypothetical protein
MKAAADLCGGFATLPAKRAGSLMAAQLGQAVFNNDRSKNRMTFN